MKNLNFIKWRAMVAGLLLATIVGFLYGKKSVSETVLIVLSVASVLNILFFYYLTIKELKNDKN